MTSGTKYLELETQLKNYQIEENYQKIIISGEKALSDKTNYSDELFLFLCEAYEKFQYWDRMIELIEQFFEFLQTEQTKYVLLNQKLEAQINLGRFEYALQTIEHLKKLCKKHNKQDELQQVMEKEQIIKKEQGKTFRSIEKRKEEARSVIELFQYSEEQGLFQIQGICVYVVPQKWFNQWKKYTFFQEVLQNNEGQPDDEDNEINPGKIDISNLLQFNENQLIDPDPIRKSTNLVLNPKLRRNVDYYVLPQPIHRFFKDTYGGEGIRRLVIWQDEENENTTIEVALRSLNIIVFDEFSQDSTDWNLRNLNICSKETGLDIKEKIIRCLRSEQKEKKELESKYLSTKLWKLKSKENLETYKKQFSETPRNNKMDIVEIQNSKSIEDSEVAEDDILLFEIFSKKPVIVSLNNNSRDSCANCGQGYDLQFCMCYQLKYCSKKCQNDHRSLHKDICQNIMKTQELKDKYLKQFSITKPLYMEQMTLAGLNGLQNLGNTCFMNSSIQCLSNVREITQYMISNKFIDDINTENPLGTRGKLASSYAELLKEIWGPNQKTVSAWSLKKIVSHIAPQFSGYQQQDSQELLSYIVDGIHEDLNRVKKKEVVENLDFDGQNDLEDSKKAWDNYLKRNRSIIQEMMVGQYKSTIVCPDCKKVSVTYDPYQIISVPIQKEVKRIDLQVYLIKRDPNDSPGRWEITIKRTKKISDLYKMLEKKCDVSWKELKTVIIQQNKKIREFEPDQPVSVLERESKNLIFVYQMFDEEEDGADFDKKNGIEFEICIGYYVKNSFNQITYPRILNIKKDLNFEKMHLKVYKILRPYILKFYEQYSELIEDHGLKFYQETTEENLKLEYEALKKAKRSPVDRIEMINDQKITVLESDPSNSLADMYNIQQKKLYKLEIQIILNSCYTSHVQTMKFNRCHQEKSPVESDDETSKQGTLNSCLDLFIQPEILDSGNEWYCNKCKKHQNARKTLEIYKTPKILIIHLKRFQQGAVVNIGSHLYTNGYSKITQFVDFPLQGLDLKNYILDKSVGNNTIYDLFAVSNHYGNMSGGHYTAYAKNPLNKKWYDYNDSTVTEASINQIVTGAAYCLFYRLRE